MKVGYTEFSFGYAFTENLIRSSRATPAGAPVFPNLIQEAQLGYDVNINLPGRPLFFQFKLSELMVRNSASEIAQHALSGIRIPFFRMSLMRRDLSKQHHLLMRLDRRLPNSVYYATPCIENATVFNLAYNSGQIHQQTVFFSPQDIGDLPDDKQHTIAYRAGLRHGWVCSDPREISAESFTDIERHSQTQFNQQNYRTLARASETISNAILALASPQMRASAELVRERIRARRLAFRSPDISDESEQIIEELLMCREIARVDLGLEMLVEQPSLDRSDQI
jgi:hypothetical protein